MMGRSRSTFTNGADVLHSKSEVPLLKDNPRHANREVRIRTSYQPAITDFVNPNLTVVCSAEARY